MMSKIDMSIWTSVSTPWGTVSSTLLTRVPTVWRYVSWYSLRTNRRIREVLPTPPSPIRASFAFMCLTVGIGKTRAAPHSERGYKQFRRVDGGFGSRPTFAPSILAQIRRQVRRGSSSKLRSTSPRPFGSRRSGEPRAQFSRCRRPAFYVPRIGISTNIDAFIPPGYHVVFMRFRPEGPRIPVPNWLIEWSKSRDLFLTLAHDPWVFRPN